MKLQPDRIEGVNAITGFVPGTVRINGQPFSSSVVLPWRGEVQAWPCKDFAGLESAHFEQLLAHAPELVIFGSGVRLRFPRPEWLQDLMARRIGVETMDTAAACRTYNILAGEGRNVIVALLLEQGL